MSLKSIEEATRSMTGYEPLQENTYRQSISFSLSFLKRSHEGLSIAGDMSMSKTATAVPQRASKPVDIEQEYDDDSVTHMPRSAVRFRSTQPQAAQTPTTGPIVAPIVTHRVSGSTRLGLYLLLFLCLAFLFNGLLWPVIVDIGNQLKYGDARIATYDIANHHFLTQDDNGKVRIVVSSADNQHNQVLTTVVHGVGTHALVTLSQDGGNVDVSIAGIYTASLVPDAHGSYKWKDN